MQCLEIKHFSLEYWQTVELRYQVLRLPLQLDFAYTELKHENDSHHLALINDNAQLVACLVMKPLTPQEIKMRQVAVADSEQGKGLGKILVNFSESFAQELGYQWISLHARETAVPFYRKLNYEVVGEKFEEVNIPHFKMHKRVG
ncbi:MAG: GNAT family N-acetyltransferase [Microscillaceae bacterium]|jgi:predicted GNAT family N-acyltransferase|nr:GNAT family N-acetyltransferase [Microscillaceae bacterium]